MIKGRVAGTTLFMVIAVMAVQILAQQDEVPILRPTKPLARPASATLLVMCDLACNWKLDGEVKGSIDAGGSAKVKAELGQHLVVAATTDGVDQVQQFSEIKATGQTIVTIELKPVRNARLEAQLVAKEEAARMQDLRDHAGDRLKEGLALYGLKRYEEARPLLQKACDGGAMDGCNSLGVLFENGQGVSEDFAQARILHQKACDGGEMDGCADLGGLYLLGLGGPKDELQARELFQKACDGKGMMGCAGLGAFYESGRGVPKDYSQARTLFQKACDGGEVEGCEGLGNLYFRGEGVPRDYAQSRTLFQKACDGGEMEACDKLGGIYYQGLGVKRDYAKARMLAKKACDGGEQSGCDHLRNMP